MGLPDEAIVFNSPADDPYGGTDLDDGAARDYLDSVIPDVRPGLVFIDTLTNATGKDLCRQNEVKVLMAPLIEIAQRHQVTIVPLLHLSRDGQALGRRIKGITCTLIQLECPDPEKPHHLRLWVEKTYAKRPAPLGVLMGDKGNEYDAQDIPKPPEKSTPGRPPEAVAKARQFILDELGRQNDRKTADLCNEFVKAGGAEGTFFRARDGLAKEGLVSYEGKPQLLHLHQSAEAQGQEEDDPLF
jgi:hypothetical protein